MNTRVVDYEGYRLYKACGYLDGRSGESRELSRQMFSSEMEFDAHQVLDLSAVEYINSTVLGSFVRFLSEVQECGYKFAILGPSAAVKSILEMTGLSVVIGIADDENELLNLLDSDREEKIDTSDIDYEILCDELESIIKGEEEDGDQLRRLRGK